MYARFSLPVCAVGRLPSAGAGVLVISTLPVTSLATDLVVQAEMPVAPNATPAAASKAIAHFLKFFIFLFTVSPQRRTGGGLIFTDL